MPRSYVRDLAITAVICFTGGVGLTLLAVLIYYRVSQRKKQRERERLKEDDERNTTVISNHVSHLHPPGNQQFEGKAMVMDTRVENHGGHVRPRMEDDGSHFRCLDCAIKQQRGEWPSQMRGNNGINRAMEVEEETERRKMRILTEEEKRKPRKGILSIGIPDKFLSLGNSNSVSHPGRETFNERPEILSSYKTDRDTDSFRTDRKNNGHETSLHCESCHRTYRPPGRNHTYTSFPPQHRMTDRDRSIYHKQLDVMMMNRDFRRESRNVTFDLEGLRNLEQGDIQGEDKREEKLRSPRHKEKGRKKKQLKVKLNLSPLRKNKVHPKRKNEQGHSSKKGKENRRDGKEREEKEEKPKSSKKTKESNKKTTKSTDSPDKERRKKEDKDGKSTSLSEQETTLKSEQGGREETTPAQEENTDPGNSRSGDSANNADQQTLSTATGQGHNVQTGSIQYHEAGMVLRNQATNLSLLGSTASRLTGSSLSIQGGNMLLNTMASGSKSLAPAIAISGPNLASSGGLGGFGRQTGVGIVSPATSLLANVVHANSLQASGMQPPLLHNSQVGGLSTNLAANPGIIQTLSQSQLTPDSSPVVTRQTNGPGSGLQKAEGPHQPSAESQAPQTKNGLPMQAQAPQNTEGLSGVTDQVLALVTPVESLSGNNSQTGTGKVPDSSSLNGGNVGPAVGLSGDNKEATDMSLSGVSVPSVSTQNGPSTGGADGTTALLQQEYVSEEGTSSPRRKLRLVLPEKTSSRAPTALEKKIR
ncbi:hypothetical protein JOB18_022592 [Solea senegalensis]|uniref:Uncharacterized protein n=1 Tax=Solea senegalensis TaxID=28829 RepID=A0AAV6T6R7_SOLSE|nr:uncharacterized protein lrrc53 [Solea senegalensis]KAG7525131.1 hypothetical protein JOB18_022592 [Solea senegalensis]